MITIKLYGTSRCHKTKYYKAFLEEIKVEYQFFDVEESFIFQRLQLEKNDCEIHLKRS